ncbi:aminotransferase class I/II-fold pyridoxal phosphate-dependent enzyme [Gluconacetobacter diazotrophicus]|uniref:Aminotransferase class I/II-fold pyridoxal phosphate-dependent enzyme n=2 Tax=Gluconacetobacter diazotrophicus TaxID=33996 RepID=A0A7W4FEI1_GLUDI|nr:aminotransferase class I/II-fold pyridoxal phosphate-dependent enzyme [Gluconacetobacter diazotrophicus]MBB2156308.1 aminotransferase class I/II-fold pyridoxal phosphate-dependent enzyme [Gluconacetobacter diazotrophicus]CAP56340.1 putative 2-amino-3-ketobutyrate coenzyme A ligase [Gluconacetobacter diazotrophicus PA1 5]
MTGPKFGRRLGERIKLLASLSGAAPAQTGSRGWSLPGVEEMEFMAKRAAALGIADPFFRQHDGLDGATTSIDGRSYINFSSYDYLGLNGDPRIIARVEDALRKYGTTVSASRMVSGERPFHRELEHALAEWHGAEDCVVMVSGHATNVTTLAQLMRPGDLIVHDALAHNSLIQGAILSGARRVAFAHNDVAAAREQLWMHRKAHKRALLVLEGHYSMDGDIPDLAAFVALAREFDCMSLVDEAHSTGVLGAGGHGIAEQAGVAPDSVDLWMGTLSKSLVSCGGYIAGRADVITYLKRTAAGFVYSVGLPPPGAAASLAALDIIREEPWRIARLRENSVHLLRLFQDAGFDTGSSAGYGIVPLVTGSSVTAGRLSQAVFEQGINVQPIIHPAVPERAARLRFFVSASHTTDQIETTAAVLVRELQALSE